MIPSRFCRVWSPPGLMCFRRKLRHSGMECLHLCVPQLLSQWHGLRMAREKSNSLDRWKMHCIVGFSAQMCFLRWGNHSKDSFQKGASKLDNRSFQHLYVPHLSKATMILLLTIFRWSKAMRTSQLCQAGNIWIQFHWLLSNNSRAFLREAICVHGCVNV